MTRPDAALCPQHIRESIDAYVKLGRATGGFLRAVLENDLRGAVARADDINAVLLPHIVYYLCSDAVPAHVWGSLHKVEQHLAKMRRAGHTDARCICKDADPPRASHDVMCDRCVAAGCAQFNSTDPCRVTGEVRA